MKGGNLRRFPDDEEYAEYTVWFDALLKEVLEMDKRIRSFNAAVTTLFSEAESVAVQSVGLFGPNGIGRNGDFSLIRDMANVHKSNWAGLSDTIKRTLSDMEVLQLRIDERNKLKEDMLRLKKLVETPSADSDQAVKDFEDASAAEDAYFVGHNKSLYELMSWRDEGRGKRRLQVLHYRLKQTELAFFRADAAPIVMDEDEPPNDPDAPKPAPKPYLGWIGGAVKLWGK